MPAHPALGTAKLVMIIPKHQWTYVRHSFPMYDLTTLSASAEGILSLSKTAMASFNMEPIGGRGGESYHTGFNLGIRKYPLQRI